jgi:glycosyltransferase involved in cell wall biosynthesis
VKICMILQSDFPPDIRVSKEARTLIDKGHEVHLLCNNAGLRRNEETVSGIHVHRLGNYFTSSRMNKVLNIPLFFNPVWILNLIRLQMKYKMDVLHVHDLPLVMLGIILGRILGIPVIYDMHENYPAAMRDWNRKGFFIFLIKNRYLAQLLDTVCMRFVDAILVVVDEQRDRLMKAGVPKEKIYVVPNTVDVDEYVHLPIYQQIIERYQRDCLLLYLGKFSSDRGLETAISATRFIREHVPDVKLLLVGDGPNRQELERLVEREGNADCVEFTGWRDFEETPSFIAASRICIIPQPATPSINTTLPHKLFQYMLMGKPVVVSNARPLARIVRECQCGAVFRSRDPESFARAVIRILQKREACGENGRRAVYSKYNWENTSKELVRVYARLTSRKSTDFGGCRG